MLQNDFAVAIFAGLALLAADLCPVCAFESNPSPTADLNLFPPDDISRTNLKRLLENMAKVEIGPLKVRTELIAAAIERLEMKTLAEGSLVNSPVITTNETAATREFRT